jgi:hypothetical protein
VSVVGRSTRENAILPGSSAYNALDVSLNPKISHGLPGASESEAAQTRRMLYELRMKLDELSAKCQALTPPLAIRVVEGWVPPERANSVEGGAIHSEGRAVDILVLDAAGNPAPDSLKIVGGIASDVPAGGSALFDWVSHIDRKVDSAGVEVPAHLHLSIKMPALKALVNSGIQIGDDNSLDTLAQAHLRTIMDPTDASTLDAFIRKYRDTPSGKAALAIRYSTLREKGTELLTFAEDGQKKLANYDATTRSKLERQASDLAHEYNDFISAHPNTVASYTAALELLQIRRFQNDSLGYLDYISRYPYLAEVQLAIDSLYLLEATTVLSSEVTVDECDAYLLNYPYSPQWTVVAEFAAKKEISLHLSIKATWKDRVEYAKALLGTAVKCFQELRRLRRPVPQPGTVEDSTEVLDVYLNPGRARYFLAKIDRIERVLSAVYRSTPAYARLLRIELDWETNGNIRQVSRQLADLESFIGQSQLNLRNHLEQRFEEIRDEIRTGFHRIGEQIISEAPATADTTSSLEAALDRRFAELLGTLSMLRADITIANVTLAELVEQSEDITKTVNAVSASLRQTEQRLSAVVSNVKSTADAIDAFDIHVTQQLESVRSQIKEFTDRGLKFSFDPTKPFGGGFNLVRNGLGRLAKSVKTELGNLTVESIREVVGDPLAATRAAVRRGERSVRVEAGRAIEQLKKEELYKALQRILIAGGRKLLLEKGPEPVECHTVDGTSPVLYVNGMMTAFNSAMIEGKSLGMRINRTVLLIHNPTEAKHDEDAVGIARDLEQCTLDRIWPANLLYSLCRSFLDRSASLQHNQTTRFVAYHLYEHSGRMDIVCHSQGTLIMRNAVLSCSVLGEDVSDYHVIFTGTPMGDDELFPNVPGKVYRNRGDPVCDIFGFQGIDFTSAQNAAKHNFVLEYVTRITGTEFDD